MKEYPQEQWLLAKWEDPTNWVAELWPFKDLPAMGAFLVSLRRLSADMVDLILLGPPFDPEAHPVEQRDCEPVTPADKGKQAKVVSDAPPVAGPSVADTEAGPIVLPEAEAVAEASAVPFQAARDAPLTAQGLVCNDPEVSPSFGLVVGAADDSLWPAVPEVHRRRSCLYPKGRSGVRRSLPALQGEQTRLLDLCLSDEAARA